VIAALHIQTGLRGNSTYLKNAFCTPPFKVANITEDKKDHTLQLMLMSSSPGILDEDEYTMKIELAENNSLHLHTQSYQRLFNMKKGATQRMDVSMQPGSSFCFLPHPSVPHEKAVFTTRNHIHLSTGCRLVWGEVLTCGRKGNGEVFLFSHYHSMTDVFLGQKLVLRENMLITPSSVDITALGLWEGFTHQASLIYLDGHPVTEEILRQLNDWLSTQPGIIYGITAAPVSGLVIRLLGYKAEQLFNCLKRLAQLLMPAVNTSKPIAYAH
jgi:urease accessory protein